MVGTDQVEAMCIRLSDGAVMADGYGVAVAPVVDTAVPAEGIHRVEGRIVVDRGVVASEVGSLTVIIVELVEVIVDPAALRTVEVAGVIAAVSVVRVEGVEDLD